MYWSRTGSPTDLVLLAAHCGLWVAGGWLLASHAFRLESRERMVVGVGMGLAVYLFVANLLGHILEAGAAFWTAALVVLLFGLAAAYRSGRAWLDGQDLKAWPLVAAMGALGLLTTFIGRGLTVFDDPRNLSLVSIMAAGDIPPHFYLNASIPFDYHYGLQLLGASFMRIGGLFPWSAYDLSKGIVAALAVGLFWLVGRRLTHRWEGGLAMAFLAFFAGGARWLLLLLPQSLLIAASREVELWGSAAASAQSLWDGLSAAWVVGGGPPSPIPMAFVSGVFQPVILASQVGPPVLSAGILALVILTAERVAGFRGVLALAAVMALWALAWEVSFVLVSLGLLLVGLTVRVWRPTSPSRQQLRWGLAAVASSWIPAVLQGGSLSEAAKDILGGLLGLEGGAAGGFSFRFSPTVVSSHLGELSLAHPPQLAVALAECGAGLVAAPLVAWSIYRWVRSGRYILAAVAVGSMIGFVVPWFAAYRVTRDLSRFHGFALLSWVMLAVPLLALKLRRRPGGGWASASLMWAFLTAFGGLVVASSLMTAMPRAVLAEGIAPLDARMAIRLWDTLPEKAEVFDSVPYRAVMLTGRLTRAADEAYELHPEYADLLKEATASRLAQAGYRYVYIDREWWETMSSEVHASYQEDCALLLEHSTDNAANGDRWVFDVGGCGQTP